MVRQFGKEYGARQASVGVDGVAAAIARWAAGLSALLIKGNGAVLRAFSAALGEAFGTGAQDGACDARIPHNLPDGDCAYELRCVLGVARAEEEEGEE